MKVNLTPMQMAVAALGVVVLGYIIVKKKPGQSLAGAAGSAAVNAAADFGSGAVIGVGEVFGIPATEKTQCEKDLAEGRFWDASFSCPAKDFVSGVFGGSTKTTGVFDAGSGGNSW
jgi:hypothetical protein